MQPELTARTEPQHVLAGWSLRYKFLPRLTTSSSSSSFRTPTIPQYSLRPASPTPGLKQAEMAPISASPAAPQSTRRIAHILPDSLEGSKQTAIYAAAIATLVLLFLFAGTYLLFLRRRRSHQSETVADAEGCTSSVTVKDTEGTLCVYGSNVHKAEDDSTTVRKPETLVSVPHCLWA